LNAATPRSQGLTGSGFPSLEPLPIELPGTGHGCVAAFWRYLPQGAHKPKAADLGRLLSRLHQRLRPEPQLGWAVS
jgi:hypothetical protein